MTTTPGMIRSLLRLAAAMALLDGGHVALAADTFPTGALAGGVQYTQAGTASPVEEYFSIVLGYAVPVSSTTPLPVNCITGCTGGGGGGGGAITAAAGALADGSLVTLGSEADAAWSGTGSGTDTAIWKAIYAELTPTAAGTPDGTLIGIQGNASGVPVPVSGSVAVSNFPGTQAISAAALPLPAGAATAANQTTVQSAPGTSATTALTVQGSSSGVAVPVTVGSLLLSQGSTTSGQSGILNQATVNSGYPSYTSGQTEPLVVNTHGGLIAQLQSSSGFSLGATAQNTSATGVPSLGQFNTSPTEEGNSIQMQPMTNSYGDLHVDTESQIPSNSSGVSFTPPTGVVWSECGSSSKVVRIRELDFSGFATTAGDLQIELIKTSSAPSGGTSGSLGWTPNDATNTSNTSSGSYYTGAPTVGTQVGVLDQFEMPLLLVGTYEPPIQKLFGVNGAQSIVLRTASQCLEVYTPTTNPSGGVIQIKAVNTEE